MNEHERSFANILLVEDNIGDIRLTQEALRENKVKVNMSVAMDGDEAMEFLLKQKKFIDAPRPDLILLDLNLPRKDGRQLLKEIKQNPDLKSIPVVVLTISSAEEDILQSYDLQANCYITKPLDLNKFTKIIKELENFWFAIVRLPLKKSHEK